MTSTTESSTLSNPFLPSTTSLSSTLTSTIISATLTATASLINDNSTTGNNTNSSPFEVNPGETGIGSAGGGEDTRISQGNPAVNFLLGIIIILLAALFNSFGLNIIKLDHMQNMSLPRERRQKRDWLRWKWLLGMTSYILSQIFGSTLALRYIRADWVAPLGSSSLVFNFMMAKWLVGTPVAKEDVRGTALIVVSVILILVFSSINKGLDGSITVARLSTLWRRPNWLSYFFLISFITFSIYTLTSLFSLLLKSRLSLSPTIAPYDPTLPPTSSGGRSRTAKPGRIASAWKTVMGSHKILEGKALSWLERRMESTGDEQIRFFEGIGWAVVGGSLAGGCLVFTKVVINLLTQPDRPFTHFSAIITLLLVIVTAVSQIVCLNKALKAADSTLVVPLFFAGYTVLGFINSLVFMNEFGQYATWTLVAIFLSIALLVGGVVLLSLKKPETPEDATAGPRGRGARTGMEDVNGTISVSGDDPSMKMKPITGNGSRKKGSSNSRPSPGGRKASGTRAWAGEDDAESSAAGVNGGAWEVGSDVSEEEDEPRRSGVGQGRVKGERGGLLFDAEPMGVDEDDVDELGKRGYDGDEMEEHGPAGYASVGIADREADSRQVGKARKDEDPFGDFEAA